MNRERLAVVGLFSRPLSSIVTQLICYGGKGGVGKTTCAAATGVKLAGRGRETVVVSTDPAHSLSDSFETSLSGVPRALRTHLWAAEVDPETRRESYRDMAATFAAELREVGIRLSDADVDDLFLSGVAPGSDEIAALDVIADFADDERFEYVVLDTAPTGHTLRLLELPAVLETTMEKVLKVRGQVRSLADSARRVVLGPYYYATGRRDADERDEFAALKERMEHVGALLRDPDRTDFRVVTTPESMAISETERLVDRLRTFDIPISTLVVNGVLEEIDEDCARCRTRRDTHRDRLDEIHRRFPGLDVQVVPEFETEVHGLTTLERVAQRIAV